MSDLNAKLEHEIAVTEDMMSIAPKSFQLLLNERLEILLALLRARKALATLDEAPVKQGHLGHKLAAWMSGYAHEALADTELEELLR